MNLPRPDQGRRLSLANAVYAMFALFMAGFFFVPNAVDLYKFYIWAVFLPGLALLPATARLAWHSPLWRVLAAYLLFMLASSLWSAALSWTDLWRDTRYVAYILGFILLVLYFQRRDPALNDAVLTAVVVVAGAAAALSVTVTEPLLPLAAAAQVRSVGFGITDNPNPSAFVYGLMAVIALHRTVRHRGTAPGYLMAACFLALTLFLYMTRSNTGMLALLAASAVLFLASARRAGSAAGVGLGLVIAAALYLSWSLGMGGSEMDQGFSARLPIWEHALELWRQAPLLGNGLQMETLLNRFGGESRLNYAHSLPLATLRDGGLVGLALLLGACGLALREAWRRARDGRGALYLGLLCFGLVVVLADVDQPITRPRELWLILWLPLALLVASELERRRPPQASGKNTRA